MMISTYWISTSILFVFLLLSAYSYIFNTNTIEGLKELGFPDFFRIQLVILKVIAAILLILPVVPLRVKEWAYAGVGLFLLTALTAHLVHKDSFLIILLLIFLFGVLITSNVSFHKMMN